MVSLAFALVFGLAAEENVPAPNVPPVLPEPPVSAQPASPPVPGAGSRPVTEILLTAPFALTHSTYAWKQVAGPPISLPPDPGASFLIPVPAPGVFAWDVVGGDGRLATPPARVRLVVVADAAAARWAFAYPDQLQLKPGDRFVIDFRNVTLEPAAASATLPQTLPSGTAAAPPPASSEVSKFPLVSDFRVQWHGLASASDVPTRLEAWLVNSNRFGPRVQEFAIPGDWPAGVYDLRFTVLAGERTLHEGVIRTVVAPLPPADRSTAATTQVIVQAVAAVLPAAQPGPGAPIVTLPYGEATLTLNLHDRLDLDGRLCSDPDGDRMTFYWWQTKSPAPAGEGTTSFTRLDPPSLWRWQPTRDADVGLHEFVLSVSDGKHLVYSPPVRVNVVASAVERSLEWRVGAGPAVVTEVGKEAVLPVTVERSDGDGWRASFLGIEPRWAQHTRPPGILRIDPAQPQSRFQPYFRADQAGVYELSFSVSAGAKVSNTVLVRVQVVEPNRPPILLDPGPVTATTAAGVPVTVELTAGDPDGDSVSLAWRPVSGPWTGADTPAKDEFTLRTAASAAEGVTTGQAIFQSARPGVWWLQASAFDGKIYSPRPAPVLIWVRETEEAAGGFGPYVVEGPSQGVAGDWLRFRVAGSQVGARFVRWRCSDPRVQWLDGREGTEVALRRDPAGFPPGAPPEKFVISAVINDGLGRAAQADAGVTILATGASR